MHACNSFLHNTQVSTVNNLVFQLCRSIHYLIDIYTVLWIQICQDPYIIFHESDPYPTLIVSPGIEPGYILFPSEK